MAKIQRKLRQTGREKSSKIWFTLQTDAPIAWDERD